MSKYDSYFLKPKIEPLDSNTQRIRRNIILTSVIAFFFSIGSEGIDTEKSSFVGIKFLKLDPDHIKILILISLIYFVLHYIWLSSDHIKENRLRLTGLKVVKTNASSPIYPSYDFFDPIVDNKNESTIHSWWIGKMKYLSEYKELMEEIKNNSETPIKDHDKQLRNINNTIHESNFLLEAIQRYEKNFWYFQKSQTIRWFIFDFGIPFLIGTASIVLLLIKLEFFKYIESLYTKFFLIMFQV